MITTYNRPERIPKAIKTVLDQSYENLEILVVDGANSEENKKQVEKFKDKRIRYLSVEPEAVDYISYKGMQHSRNVGCKKANGKYIAMLDDDDTWDPSKTEKQVNVFEKDQKLGLVLSYNKIWIKKDRYILDVSKIYPEYKDLLQSFNFSSTSAYMIKKSCLEEVGFWDETLRGMHEYDIALKISKKGYKIYTIPEPLMSRIRDENETIENTRYYYIKIAEVLDLWRKYGKDMFLKLGLKGFIFNCVKTLSLFDLFLLGYIFKEKIWNVIYPLKIFYEQKLPSKKV